MVSEECYELGSRSSIIREIFSFGLKRKAEIGADRVYDFSLGNPSIPAPDSVRERFWSFWRGRRRRFMLIRRRRGMLWCVK